jgi:molybdate transport system substrate-binding protein
VRRRALLAGLALALGSLLPACGTRASAAELEKHITFGCAASLRAVAPALVEGFQRGRRGRDVRLTFGSSGLLASQLEAGAPLDGVLLAGSTPVERLTGAGLLDWATVRAVATNRLVLVGAPGSPALSVEDLGELPAGTRIALGDPAFVPAGEYARDTLEAYGLWETVLERAVLASDVTAALTYVRHGEVELAIVYETDARLVDEVVVLDHLQSSPMPEVVGALAPGAPDLATWFLSFVSSRPGRRILEEHGFGTF